LAPVAEALDAAGGRTHARCLRRVSCAEDVHRLVNEIARPVGIYLLGRRMDDVLKYWDSPPDLAEQPDYVQEFAEIWRAVRYGVHS
jgi:hypothetical protein